MTTDLTTLIAKLEAATGPNRELDALIWCAVGPSQTDEEYDAAWRDSNCQLPIAPDRELSGMTLAQAIEKHPNRIAKAAAYWNVPRFTASIDAALTLVPEGMSYELHVDGSPSGPRAVSSVWSNLGGEFESEARLPSMALSAAALRARRSGGAQP